MEFVWLETGLKSSRTKAGIELGMVAVGERQRRAGVSWRKYAVLNTIARFAPTSSTELQAAADGLEIVWWPTT